MLDRALLTLTLVTLVALFGSPAVAAPVPAERVPVLVRFEERPDRGDVRALERAGGQIKRRYEIVPVIAASLPKAAIAGLSRNPRVEGIEPDQVVYGLDYRTTHDWGIPHIKADAVHNAASPNTGSGVKVAVLDSGIDCDHAELPQPRCEYGPTYVEGTSDSDDDWGHGTHVAGSIGAQRNADTASGVVGVAPSAGLTAYKVLDDEGYGSISQVIAAVDHVWNGGARRADVINMSLGWRSGSKSFQQSMDRAFSSGILSVAAAGNRGSCTSTRDTVSYPAKYASVVAVAAIDGLNQRPCWSSTGDKVELAAPGVSVFSTWPADLATSYRDPQPVCEDTICNYKFGSGTSMSAPHVAGTAALVLASGVTDANGKYGPADEVRQRLDETALDIGPAGRDKLYGYGVVDAQRAASGG